MINNYYKKVRERKIKKHKNSIVPTSPDNTVYGINDSVI